MWRCTEAQDEAARLEAYKLRYDVFSREGGDSRYADHAMGVYVDADDGSQSKLIVCTDEAGTLAGTIRFTMVRDRSIIAKEHYHFSVLAQLLNMDEEQLLNSAARVDRAVVAKPFRGKGAYQAMMRHCETIEEGVRGAILVAAFDVNSRAIMALVKRIGWLEYPVVDTYNGFTAQLMFKDCRKPCCDASHQEAKPAQ